MSGDKISVRGRLEYSSGNFICRECFGLFLPQILVKYENQLQFWNLHVLRFPKHPLIVEFDEDLAEILKVKHKSIHGKIFQSQK